MKYRDKDISVYPNVADTHATSMRMWDFIQLGERYRDKIAAIRSTDDKERRRQLKSMLPCATIAGTFSPSRKDDMLVEPSYFMCIDIDGADNPWITDWDAVKRELARKNSSLVYAGLSVGGNGLWLIYLIQYPLYYKRQFDYLVRDLFEVKHLKADLQCGNISRLRFLSYDDRPFVRLPERDDVRPYSFMVGATIRQESSLSPQSQQLQLQPTLQPSRGYMSGRIPQDEAIRRLVAKISENHIDITSSYDDWLRVGMAFASLGEQGREPFHIVSSQYPKYSRKETDKKFDNLLRTSKAVDISTFFYICEQNNITYK